MVLMRFLNRLNHKVTIVLKPGRRMLSYKLKSDNVTYLRYKKNYKQIIAVAEYM